MDNYDLKVGSIVFSPQGDTVVDSAGKLSPNPLEYAPRGTMQENAALYKLIKELIDDNCPEIQKILEMDNG